MRKVTVYNTIGGNLTEVNTSATTWGDLQNDLNRHGIPYQNMSAVEGASQVTYESPVATLPIGDFQLFLAPKKVKSGMDEYLVTLDGITWNDEDWDNEGNIPEDYTFKSTKDLAIARAKKAQFYLQKVINYLVQDEKLLSTDPKVAALQKTAEEIKRNLGLYD